LITVVDLVVTGSYLIPLTRLVGPEGKIYALDCHPEAIRMVKELVLAHDLNNVRPFNQIARLGSRSNLSMRSFFMIPSMTLKTRQRCWKNCTGSCVLRAYFLLATTT